MNGTLCLAALALTALALPAHAASKWVVVEHVPARTTSYDASSIGHYDNNNPQSYFPKGDQIRGVIMRLQYLTPSTNPNEPKVDRREQLTLFNCENGTSVPVWVELSYRGVTVDHRHFAPAVQLRTGFQPVVNQWSPAGGADDKIMKAVCSANLTGHEDILVQ